MFGEKWKFQDNMHVSGEKACKCVCVKNENKSSRVHLKVSGLVKWPLQRETGFGEKRNFIFSLCIFILTSTAFVT